MICKHCGKDIVDDAVFCSFCGKSVEKAQPAVQAVPVNEPPTPPKKRQFLVKGLVAAGVAVAAVTALLLNMETLTGTFMKTFYSDTEYYKYVELKTLKGDTDTLSGCYAQYKDVLGDPEKKIEGSLHPVLGDGAAELLGDADLAWLNDLSISYTGNFKDDTLTWEAAFSFAEEDPFTVITLLNRAEDRAFLGMPAVSEEYITTDPDKVTLPSGLERWLSDPAFVQELKAAFPTERELDKVLDRYLAIALDMVEVHTAESTTLSFGGVEQKCTAAELVISQKQAIDILTAVLTEARDDDEVREVLEQTQALLAQRGQTDGDLYARYRTAVTDMLNQLRAARKTAGDETVVTVTTYISSRHTVIGRRVTVQGKEVLYYANVVKDSRCATELRIPNVISLGGVGTLKGDVISGEYDVTLRDNAAMKLTVTDLDLGRAKDGYVNGTFCAVPNAALWEKLGANNAFLQKLAAHEPTLELTLATSRNRCDATVYAYKGESVLIGLEFDGKIGRAETVELPENTVDISAWLDGAEGETVQEKLTNAGLPAPLYEWIAPLLPPDEAE